MYLPEDQAKGLVQANQLYPIGDQNAQPKQSSMLG